MRRSKLVREAVALTLEILLHSKRGLLLGRQTIVVMSLVAQEAPQTRAVVASTPLQ